jgi:hypothetical protein
MRSLIENDSVQPTHCTKGRRTVTGGLDTAGLVIYLPDEEIACDGVEMGRFVGGIHQWYRPP